MRKDFIFSETQVYETKQSGADMMLLIAAILTENEFKELYKLGKLLGLEIITEVHNIEELRMVSKYNPEIIGVNNRNLKTFDVSLSVSEELIKYRQGNSIFISESGIKDAKDIGNLFRIGFQGFLIGEAIMSEKNINENLSKLTSYLKK